jgi:glutathione-independent formaldehyde dehydrogenase
VEAVGYQAHDPDGNEHSSIHQGRAIPSMLVSHDLGLADAPDAYRHFDNRDPGWTKVVLHPAQG